MITVAVERLAECLGELQTAFPGHALELDTYSDRRPLDPEYADYMAREAAGRVLCVVARDRGQMVGYFVAFVQPALHYRSTLTCLQDIFYVLPAYRKNPKVIIKLFRMVIAECKRRGVQEIRGGHKLGDKDLSRLFALFGFKPVETIHSLWIGGADA